MSDESTPQEDTVTASEGDSAERLLAVGAEVKKRRGRPPGSKNKPKDSDATPKVNEGNQKRIFAGALLALFAIFGVVAGWFGYEYFDKLEMSEAEEGGTYLLPIAQKVGWIAAAAFYLSFPAWFIVTAGKKFRRKPDAETQVQAPSPASKVGASPESVNGVPPGTVDASLGFTLPQEERARPEGAF